LMPSPRSKRTTAIRPSGPRPFSIVTKPANALPPLSLFSRTLAQKYEPRPQEKRGLQVAGAVVFRFTAGHRKADGGAERDPVGVFAHDVAAIDEVDRKNLVRPVTHAGLEPRLDDARPIRMACLSKGFDGP